jgi:hypothetical protein
MKKLLVSAALVFGIVAGSATVFTVTPQPAFADPCSGCVVDQPSDAIPAEPKDGCNSCAIQAPAAQKLADGGCSNCKVDQPDDGIITQDPADGGGCSEPTAPIVVADCLVT